MDRRTFLAGIAALAGIGTTRAASATPAPGQMVEGHVYCDRCDAEAFPGGSRMGADHIACRLFGSDHDTAYQVTLDGVHVEDATYEAYAGRDGWVILDTWDRAVPGSGSCSECYGGITFEVKRGDVRWWPVESE